MRELSISLSLSCWLQKCFINWTVFDKQVYTIFFFLSFSFILWIGICGFMVKCLGKVNEMCQFKRFIWKWGNTESWSFAMLCKKKKFKNGLCWFFITGMNYCAQKPNIFFFFFSVPIIVAINKIDKLDADIVSRQLLNIEDQLPFFSI